MYSPTRSASVASYMPNLPPNNMSPLDFQTGVPQVGRTKCSESHTDSSVSSMDSGGLCEIKCRAEQLSMLKSGNLFCYKGNTNDSYGGVGFLINKRLSAAIQKVDSISSRVCYLILKLSKRYNLKIVQIYAPTSSSDDQEIEQFYADLNQALQQKPKGPFEIVMGDSNQKIVQFIKSASQENL